MTAAARSPLAGGAGAARLRVVALVLLLLPPLTLLPGLLDGDFDARPWEALNAASGEWALWVLLATLAITPLRRVGHWPRLLLVRRRVGVGCFCYLAFHLLAFVADKGFALGLVAGEIAQRTYLIVGFAAFVVLAALAATSTDAMLRRLGGRRWRRLHKLVYAAAILGVLHVFLQSKLELARPSLFGGLLLWLLAYRAAHWWATERAGRRGLGWPALLGLALCAGLSTALLEAGALWLSAGAPFWRVLEANLSLALGLRPPWIVLLAGLAFAGLALWRRPATGRVRARRPAAAAT